MSKGDTTLSPYFNHEILGAVISTIATSSILKVAQGAYGAPGAVADAQLFDQPKMRVERAAAQPSAAGVSDIVAKPSSTLADPSSARLTIGSMRKWASGWLRVRLANTTVRRTTSGAGGPRLILPLPP